MWHGVSKYRWRAHEKAAYNKKSADKKRQEAAEDAHQNKVIIALERIGQEINRAADKAKPKHKREWPWKLGFVEGDVDPKGIVHRQHSKKVAGTRGSAGQGWEETSSCDDPREPPRTLNTRLRDTPSIGYVTRHGKKALRQFQGHGRAA